MGEINLEQLQPNGLAISQQLYYTSVMYYPNNCSKEVNYVFLFFKNIIVRIYRN